MIPLRWRAGPSRIALLALLLAGCGRLAVEVDENVLVMSEVTVNRSNGEIVSVIHFVDRVPGYTILQYHLFDRHGDVVRDLRVDVGEVQRQWIAQGNGDQPFEIRLLRRDDGISPRRVRRVYVGLTDEWRSSVY